MTTRARAFRDAHAPDQHLAPALPAFHDAARLHGGLGPVALRALAETIHLPLAPVRGAASSFDQSAADPKAVRVCTGTSCFFAGGEDLARELRQAAPIHPVACLGYCDRSPVAMTALGRVVPRLARSALPSLSSGELHPHPAPPSVRLHARAAIATARLLADHDPLGPAPDYPGLRAALLLPPGAVIDAVAASGLRGRGGAAFPTGRKWNLAALAQGSPKFIVANGDEGDPGSFIDRELMERDPHAILEAMAIAAHAVGASRGIVFIRAEYPRAAEILATAITRATERGFLGQSALGPGKPFHIEIVRGLGSYVCGEETALLAAIEGRRGEVSPRPPYPVHAGLFGRPTVVDNVETLANIPWILTHGPAAFAAMGTPDSKGTKALCFNHGFARPGVVEVEFGLPLRDAIDNLAGGGARGARLAAVLLGGPMGSIVTPDQWDAPICFAGMARRGINLGHGGLVAIPEGVDWNALLRHLLGFMRDESCGKCAPCRLGSLRAHDLAARGLSRADLPEFNRILALMKEASLCAFGRETPGPILTILGKFSPVPTGEAAP